MLARLLADLEAEVGPLTVMVEASDEHDAPLWGDYHASWPYQDRFEARTRDECLASRRDQGVRPDRRPPRGRPARRWPAGSSRRSVATLTQAGLGFIEICPPGVDKATGLTVVAQTLGVDPADVLVFGDMPNDLPMFGWAGWARVAVANAHPTLRAVADEVTLRNDDDGVAVYLDRLLSR